MANWICIYLLVVVPMYTIGHFYFTFNSPDYRSYNVYTEDSPILDHAIGLEIYDLFITSIIVFIAVMGGLRLRKLNRNALSWIYARYLVNSSGC